MNLKEFDDELHKLLNTEAFSSDNKVMPEWDKVINRVVERIHEIRLLCKKMGLGDEATDALITKFVFDIQTDFGYQAYIREEYGMK